METERNKIVKKFKLISDKYHNLSLLFNELSKSINIEIKKQGIDNSRKKIKEYLKTLNLDFDKIIELSQAIKNIQYIDLKK